MNEEESTERYIYYLSELDNINVYVKIPENKRLMTKKSILEVKNGDLLFTNNDDYFIVEDIQKYEIIISEDETEKVLGFIVSDDTYKPGKKFIMEKNGRIYHFPPLNNNELIDSNTFPDGVHRLIKQGNPGCPAPHPVGF